MLGLLGIGCGAGGPVVATAVVDKAGDGDFLTIQAAVTATTSGTILVRNTGDGIYTEAVDIPARTDLAIVMEQGVVWNLPDASGVNESNLEMTGTQIRVSVIGGTMDINAANQTNVTSLLNFSGNALHTDITFRDVHFIGGAGADDTHWIILGAGERVKFLNCTLIHTGAGARGFITSGFTGQASNWLFDACRIVFDGTNGFQSNANVDFLTVTNCVIDCNGNVTTTEIFLPSATDLGWVICNNQFTDGFRAFSGGGSDFTVNNNFFNNTEHVFRINAFNNSHIGNNVYVAGTNFILTSGSCNENVIVGNKIRALSGVAIGIELFECSISGNQINAATDGIVVSSEGNTITGNNVVNGSGDGIRVTANKQAITGNTTKANGGSGIELASANHCTVTGNLSVDNTGNDIEETGTSDANTFTGNRSEQLVTIGGTTINDPSNLVAAA